jgi:hypothetical protein
MTGSLKRRFAGLAITAALSFASQSALALVAEVDSFTIVKSGGVLFQDTFADDVAPPAAPGEFATYLFPVGGISEANGKLGLNAASGPLEPNSGGSLSNVARVTFSTNIVPAESTGLKSNQAFNVSAVFGLLDATSAGDGYGIRLTDRDALGQLGAGTSGDDVIELSINHLADGRQRLQLLRQNFIAGAAPVEIAGFDLLATNYLALYETVELTLTKQDVSTGTIAGSARFFKTDGTSSSPIVFISTADAFHGENWTRAELFASQAPVPEPQTYALLLTGLGLVGWRLRRKSRQAAAARIA